MVEADGAAARPDDGADEAEVVAVLDGADGPDGEEPAQPRSGARRPARPARRWRDAPVSSLAGFDGPPPLHRLVRSWRWAGWMVAGMVVLRVLAVAGLRLYLYVDSAEYDVLDFTGHARRPWATPLLYWLIPGTNRSLLIGQALVGAVCWSVLALSAAAWFRLPAMRMAVAGTLLVVGCTTTVTNWDAAKLSESLCLSLTVLLIAAWLNFLRRTDRYTALGVGLATLPWLFVRQSLLASGWLVVALACVGAAIVWLRGNRSKVLPVLCLALVIMTAVATATYRNNQEILRDNLVVIVANRIATNPDRLAWFEEHGMPVPEDGKLDVESLSNDFPFWVWVNQYGPGQEVYAEYLATHPWYTATQPLGDFANVKPSFEDEDYKLPAAMLSPPDSYAAVRPVLPQVVEDLLFGPGDTGAVIFGLVVIGGWTLARRARRSMRWTVPLALVVVSFSSLYTGWHGATPELGRLALIGAVGIRIGLLLQLAFLVEDEIVRRRPGTQAPSLGLDG